MLRLLLSFCLFPALLVAQPQFAVPLLQEKAPQQLEAAFDSLVYLRRYHPTNGEQKQPLEIGYGLAALPQPLSTPPETGSIQRVDLVFTSYPRKHDIWIYPYPELLADRLRALLDWAPALNDAAIEWRLVLQTGATTTPQAKNYWHGWVLHSRSAEAPSPALSEANPSEPESRIGLNYKPSEIPNLAAYKEELSLILDSLQGDNPTTDIVTEVLERHPQWRGSTVVIDFTGSMYGYAKQVLLFALDNLQKGYIRNFVFFNDGDDLDDEKKQVGQTGGIYGLAAENASELLDLVRKVTEGGDGGDLPENDLEALLYAQQQFDQPEDIILIADNFSCMRDWELLSQLKNCRVHVILCGAEAPVFVRPLYLNLAHLTKGSLHLRQEDFYDLEQLELEINQTRYRKTTDRGYIFKVPPRFYIPCE